jgi:hypothetical protein
VKFVFCTIFFVLSLSATASETNVLADIFPDAQAYPHSEIVDQRSEAAADYLLGLGPLQKIHGVWRHKKSIRLSGDLYRFTYQISGGRNVESAIEYLTNTLSSQATTLYTCESYGCGSSAQWASLIFKKRELYGLDRYQHYLAYRLPSGDKVHFLAVYAVKRANGRQYLHLDVLESDDAEDQLLPSTLVETLENGKVFPVPGLAAGQMFNKIQLQAILNALTEFKGTVALVCHRYGEEHAEILLDSAQQWCDAARQQLVDEGVDSGRLLALGVGSLQPTLGRRDSLELVASP